MLFCVLGVAHGATEDTDLWLFKEPQWKLKPGRSHTRAGCYRDPDIRKPPSTGADRGLQKGTSQTLMGVNSGQVSLCRCGGYHQEVTAVSTVMQISGDSICPQALASTPKLFASWEISLVPLKCTGCKQQHSSPPLDELSLESHPGSTPFPVKSGICKHHSFRCENHL